jgi:hypothetical protein
MLPTFAPPGAGIMQLIKALGLLTGGFLKPLRCGG